MKKFLKYSLYAILAIVAIAFVASLFSPAESTVGGQADTKETPENVTYEWVEVIKFQGYGKKTSKPFALGDGEKKVRYAFQSNNNMMGMFAFYVVPKGTNLMEKGGVPEVMISKTEAEDESYLNKDAGEYQIITNCTGKFGIQVLEKKPVPIEETAPVE